MNKLYIDIVAKKSVFVVFHWVRPNPAAHLRGLAKILNEY